MFRLQCSRFSAIILYSHRSLPFLGNYFTAKFASLTAVNYIVLGITMIVNMVTEYLFDKFVVFRGSEGTAQNKKSAKKDDEQVKEQA